MFWVTHVLKFDFRVSIVSLVSVKTVVGYVPHSISVRCCIGVNFFLSLFFSLFLKQEKLEKKDRILIKVRFLLLSKRVILRNTADLLDFCSTEEFFK